MEKAAGTLGIAEGVDLRSLDCFRSRRGVKTNEQKKHGGRGKRGKGCRNLPSLQKKRESGQPQELRLKTDFLHAAGKRVRSRLGEKWRGRFPGC